MLLRPTLAADGFAEIRSGWFKKVMVHAVVPIHSAEMAFSLQHGPEELESKLRSVGISELLEKGRRSVV
jgi:hypothetical protein